MYSNDLHAGLPKRYSNINSTGMADSNNDGFSKYYTLKDMDGVQCIEWDFPNLPENKVDCDREKVRRRRKKTMWDRNT